MNFFKIFKKKKKDNSNVQSNLMHFSYVNNEIYDNKTLYEENPDLRKKKDTIVDIFICKANEYINITEYALNNDFKKSSIYANLFMAEELVIKKKIYSKSQNEPMQNHNLEYLAKKIDDKKTNKTIEQLRELISEDNLNFNDVTDFKYNSRRNLDILIEHDYITENFKERVSKILKWIKEKEILRNN